ncbi:hypothetical protein B0H14DRAFT_1164609 [Mycena olivaceomarginata]|nr:hypothetical protein B0H14DRAFT_1164609 [Mycena olivaceomarginata]
MRTGWTVLEIFTHEQPYNNIKHTTDAVIRAAKGEKPPRPTAEKVIRRGLDDGMWGLLCLCWTKEPSQRPTIQKVLDLLSSASASILDDTGAGTFGASSGDGISTVKFPPPNRARRL